MTIILAKRNISNNNFIYCQGRIFMSALIMIAVFGLVVFYLFEANSAVSQGYQIRSYQEKIKELESQNAKLEIEIASLQFPANLEEIAKNLNMVKTDQVVYLKSSQDVASNPQNNKN